jgi:hypothetical protein
MRMTKAKKKALVEDFKQARAKIAARADAGYLTFICWALETAAAKDLVQERLGRHQTLGDLLNAQAQSVVYVFPRDFVTARLTYLDQLIKEFS